MNIDVLKIIESNVKIEDVLVLDILNNKKWRSIFINQYGFFKFCNIETLSVFIKSNYKLEIMNDFKIDLLDLAININFFDKNIYNLIKLDIYKRKNYLLKLTMLDYINTFYKVQSVNRDYILLSNFIYKTSSNNLLIFQSLLNLSINSDSIRKGFLLKLSNKTLEQFYYYRTVNCFIDFQQFKEIENFKEFLINLITNTNNLNLNQKEELLNRIAGEL
jgi:hypothetical protein